MTFSSHRHTAIPNLNTTTMDNRTSEERTLALQNQQCTAWSIILSIAAVLFGFAYTSMSSESVPSTTFALLGLPVATIGAAGAQFFHVKALEVMWRLTIPRTAVSCLGVLGNLAALADTPDILCGIVLGLATLSLIFDTAILALAAYYSYELSTRLQLLENLKWLRGGGGKGVPNESETLYPAERVYRRQLPPWQNV